MQALHGIITNANRTRLDVYAVRYYCSFCAMTFYDLYLFAFSLQILISAILQFVIGSLWYPTV